MASFNNKNPMLRSIATYFKRLLSHVGNGNKIGQHCLTVTNLCACLQKEIILQHLEETEDTGRPHYLR
jgi:hypothetical protein